MTEREDKASSRFSCSERERAAFEAGIKMATIYHQFVGTPVNLSTVEGLEKTISKAIEVQPFVESACVKIDRSGFVKDGDTYSYVSLTGDMIDAIVKIRLGNTSVTAEMRYDEELMYPLMFISDIQRSELHAVDPDQHRRRYLPCHTVSFVEMLRGRGAGIVHPRENVLRQTLHIQSQGADDALDVMLRHQIRIHEYVAGEPYQIGVVVLVLLTIHHVVPYQAPPAVDDVDERFREHPELVAAEQYEPQVLA